MPTSFSVANEAQLNAAIQQIDVGGASAATNTAYSITLTAGFMLTGNLDAINLASGSSLTVQGSNATINGGGVQRGFFVYSGTVAIDNLAITDAVATGGAGATISFSGGGGSGGLGAGGALFVASGGNVTLSNVAFTGSSAIGGAGGAGGGGSARCRPWRCRRGLGRQWRNFRRGRCGVGCKRRRFRRRQWGGRHYTWRCGWGVGPGSGRR
jgi:hypothetical protein